MIYLFRHGETLYNLENKFLGETDLDLCEQGIKNFASCALGLQIMKIKKIYSSAFKRATQSAAILSSTLNIPYHINTDLGERSLGILDGKLKSDPLYAGYIPRLMDLKFSPPGSESGGYFLNKFSIAMTKIVKDLTGNIVVVSHGGVIALYCKYLLNVQSHTMFLDNGSYHLLNVNAEGKIYAEKFNQKI